MYSRTSGDPAEGITIGYFYNIYIRTYCTSALIKRATYSFARYTGLFPDVRHDVLNIVHVSIVGFLICVERCSTMRCLAGTAHYLLNCIMRANNGL